MTCGTWERDCQRSVLQSFLDMLIERGPSNQRVNQAAKRARISSGKQTKGWKITNRPPHECRVNPPTTRS